MENKTAQGKITPDRLSKVLFIKNQIDLMDKYTAASIKDKNTIMI